MTFNWTKLWTKKRPASELPLLPGVYGNKTVVVVWESAMSYLLITYYIALFKYSVWELSNIRISLKKSGHQLLRSLVNKIKVTPVQQDYNWGVDPTLLKLQFCGIAIELAIVEVYICHIFIFHVCHSCNPNFHKELIIFLNSNIQNTLPGYSRNSSSRLQLLPPQYYYERKIQKMHS